MEHNKRAVRITLEVQVVEGRRKSWSYFGRCSRSIPTVPTVILKPKVDMLNHPPLLDCIGKLVNYWFSNSKDPSFSLHLASAIFPRTQHRNIAQLCRRGRVSVPGGRRQAATRTLNTHRMSVAINITTISGPCSACYYCEYCTVV